MALRTGRKYVDSIRSLGLEAHVMGACEYKRLNVL